MAPAAINYALTMKYLLTRRQVVRDDVVRDVAVQDHLKAGQGVVAKRAVGQEPVLDVQGRDVDVVVEDDGAGGLDVTLDPGRLQEDHLGVVVGVGADLELAGLQEEK